MGEPKVCPECGRRAPFEEGEKRLPDVEVCLPTNCSAWRVIGKSKNGGPLLHLVTGSEGSE